MIRAQRSASSDISRRGPQGPGPVLELGARKIVRPYTACIWSHHFPDARFGHRRPSDASIELSTGSASCPTDSPRIARSARRVISAAQRRSTSSRGRALSSSRPHRYRTAESACRGCRRRPACALHRCQHHKPISPFSSLRVARPLCSSWSEHRIDTLACESPTLQIYFSALTNVSRSRSFKKPSREVRVSHAAEGRRYGTRRPVVFAREG